MISLGTLLIALIASAKAQEYDLYSPIKSTSQSVKPLLVFVHGGAWVSGTASKYQNLGRALSGRGYCTAILDYKLAPISKHPAQVADLDQALDKLKRVDPAVGGKAKTPTCLHKGIVLMGHSAGAHMIAFWASTHRDSAIRGFVGIEGIYDVPLLVKTWPGYKDQFIVDEFGPEEKWEAASPALVKIENRASWLLLQSKKDELVDVEQSIEFQTHLKSQGLRAELTMLSSDSHFGVIENLEKKNTESSQAIDKFIRNL